MGSVRDGSAFSSFARMDSIPLLSRNTAHVALSQWIKTGRQALERYPEFSGLIPGVPFVDPWEYELRSAEYAFEFRERSISGGAIPTMRSWSDFVDSKPSLTLQLEPP